MTTTLGGRLVGRLISARSTVSDAVIFGPLSGPVTEAVPLAVIKASSRAATRKLASVADRLAVGPDAPLRTKLPCALTVPDALSPAENEARVKRSRSPTRSAVMLVS